MKTNILELVKKDYGKFIKNYNFYEACEAGIVIEKILKNENKKFIKGIIKNNANSALEAFKMCEKEFEKYDLQEKIIFYMTSIQLNDNNEWRIVLIY